MCRGGRECRVFGCKQSDVTAGSNSASADTGQAARLPSETVVSYPVFSICSSGRCVRRAHACVGHILLQLYINVPGTTACVCLNMYMATQHAVYDYISDTDVYVQASEVPDGLSPSVSRAVSSVFVGDAATPQEKANDSQHNVQVSLCAFIFFIIPLS